MDYEVFYNWLKWQCENLPELQHSEEYLKKVFFIGNIEKVDIFTTNEIKPQSYCVVAYQPSIDFESNKADVYDFLVFIGHYTNAQNVDLSNQNAFKKSAKLLRKLYYRMEADDTETNKFGGLSVAKVPATPVVNFLENYTGYLWSVSIGVSSGGNCTDVLGLTPVNAY